jgi:ferrous iron transport protein B
MIAPVQAGVHQVALLGNPNTGKTTLFNALTGLSQRIANYPGVTVEPKVGVVEPGFELIDLPGTYSLAAYSLDELAAVNVLLGAVENGPKLSAAVIVVDASNLPRNLYLVTQVMETGLPIVIALNMVDAAERSGIRVDPAALAEMLKLPVIPCVATRRTGLEELRKAMRDAVNASPPEMPWRWPVELERAFGELHASCGEGFLVRRALLDEGGAVERALLEERGEHARDALVAARKRLHEQGALPALLETRMRYDWINRIVERCVRHTPEAADDRDRLDRFLTHRVWGTVVFALTMTAMFLVIFEGATPFMDWIDGLFTWIGGRMEAAFGGTALAGGALSSLLVHGIVAGVGAVLIFLPQIVFLFFFLALLEDCGYLARAALLMDRLLRFCGLSGHSFIPLLSCFACAVPGIMATRTIPDRRDRLATMLVAPLMTCSARLPVYALMIAAFVPAAKVWGYLPLQGLVFAGLYFLGILIAIPVAWIVKRLLLRGGESVFLLELPAYRRPLMRNVGLRVWEGVRSFVLRAGTVIFALSIVVWALSYYPRTETVGREYDALRGQAQAMLDGDALRMRMANLEQAEAGAYLRQSYLARMGQLVEPLVKPLGWDWRIGMAAISALPAREVVVSTMQIIFDLGDAGEADQARAAFRSRLQNVKRADGAPLFNLPVALSIMVFFALCCQCGATLATLHRESGSWRWPALAFAYMTMLAYAGGFIAFQVASRMLA